MEVDDEDVWKALEEIQGGNGNKGKGKDKEKEKDERPYWLPSTIEPTLEELPKWCLLAEVLKEIESPGPSACREPSQVFKFFPFSM